MSSTEVARLHCLYRSLVEIGRVVVRGGTRDEILRSVCASLVESGAFSMAWIGWHDASTNTLVPVAQAGDADGYLDGIRVHTDDRTEGRGPSGVAFRTNAPYVCNDVLADPATTPWRDELARRAHRASAAFPIAPDGAVRGTLSVYASSVGYFRDEELGLLTRAAADISFALERLAHDEARRRVEAQADREQRFAAELIEAMPGIFYLYDEAGHFLRWNRNFEAVTGYSAAEILRLHPLDLFSAEDKPVVMRRIADVFAHGDATTEAPIVPKSGGATPYFFTGKRLVLDGSPHLVGVGLDIEERKRAEDAVRRSEERYRTTLDTILEGCQIIGFDWRYLYLNPSAALQNRRPNGELLGRTMQEAWPGIEATAVFALLESCMDERVAKHDEIEFVFADGTSGWFDVRAQPVPEGVFVLSIDISERKRAERDLRDLNEQLEAIVVERTRDLSSARERAEAADRMKSAFLATMSHELRTPLNSILGFTGIVLKGLPGPLNAEQEKQLGMVQASARHLLDLINDVLDLSKIEAGQLEIRRAPFDMLASVERVVASVAPQVAKKGLSLRTVLPAGPQHFDGDRRRVEQILLNLLNNAIKFTDHGDVTLTVDSAPPNASDGGGPSCSVRLRVADTGIGMREEDLSKLFRPFQQIDSGLQRQHEGTGLGLAICRRLADLLGGTISAESRWEDGSVFTVVLPMLRAVGS
jgi:PAS domain S-box-containing protein